MDSPPQIHKKLAIVFAIVFLVTLVKVLTQRESAFMPDWVRVVIMAGCGVASAVNFYRWRKSMPRLG